MMIPMPPAIMNFRDDFNRSDNADVGADWRPDFDSCKIVTNRVQCSTPASNTGRQGAWETYVPVSDYNGGRLLTDNWAIEAQLIAPIGTAATDNSACIGAAMLDGGPASGMVLVYFGGMTANGQAQLTYANSSIAAPGASTGQTNQTSRASSATNIVTTDLIRFERRMYTATKSIFKSYVNGTNTTTWDDSGGVVPAGDATKRRWFIQAESNFPLFQSAFYSPAIDWVRAYDLTS